MIAATGFGVAQVLTRAAETAARAESEAQPTLKRAQEALKASSGAQEAPARQHGPRQLSEQPALKFARLARLQAKPKVHLRAPGRSSAKKPASSSASATAGPAKRPAAATGDIGVSPDVEATWATLSRKSFAGSGAPSAKGGLLPAWNTTVNVWYNRLGTQQLPGGTLELQRKIWSYVKTNILAAVERGEVRLTGPQAVNDQRIATYAENKAEEWIATYSRKLQRTGIRLTNRASTTKHGQAQGGKGNKNEERKRVRKRTWRERMRRNRRGACRTICSRHGECNA